MKCVLIVLLSIISCRGINDEAQRTTSNEIPPFLPLQMTFLENESDFKDQPQQTQPYQNLTTTLSRIVDTKYGKLQGLTMTLFPGSNNNKNPHPFRNKLVEVFLSVPYASPPIKSHRFSPTQTPIPWDGIRTVIKPGFVCPQVMPEIRDETAALKDMPRGYLDYLKRVEPYLRNQSEDCLYLNIFSPSPTTTFSGGSSSPSGNSHDSKLRLKPVLVFIHGGKFSWGSGNLYDGTLLAAYADILFVTLNYRLGVLGFLNVNTSPNTKPRVANYGLMDQIAALHWIKENIASFGGDPENITMMGYEAGAACIHFLMSSPAVVPGLFHRAILIAGSSKAPWAIVDDPSAVANALAETLNCSVTSSSTNGSLSAINSSSAFNQASVSGRERDSASFSKPTNSDPLLDCLKNKHFSYFTKFLPPKFTADFGPSVDGVVILPNYWTSLEPQVGKRDLSPKYDLMFGVSSLEMATSFSESDLLTGFETPRRDAILRTLIRNSYRFHLNEILATITNEYVDWERGIQHPISARDLTLNAVTDCLSLAPVIAASESSQIRRSYFYLFDHSTKDGLYTFQKTGGVGGEELNYFFGFPLVESALPLSPSLLPSNYTRSEMALSEMQITYLSNFVYSGNPNEPKQGDFTWPISKEKNKFRNLLWEPYDRLHQKYLELSANKIRLRSHYRAHQMAIWLRLVPELQRSGAHASALHNRMTGGFDSSLYAGSFRLPEQLEAANEIHHFDDFNFNGSGIPPSPPTTCFSPLSSISADGRGSVEASVTRSFNDGRNGTGIQQTFVWTNLPLIGIGSSLLLLNIFIFALLYYHHEKRANATERDLLPGNGNNAAESQQLNSYGEPPELLKSNSTIATSFHQSQSIYSYDDDDSDYYVKHGESVNFATFPNNESGGGMITQESQPLQQQHSRSASFGRDEELTFSHDEVHSSQRPQSSQNNGNNVHPQPHQSNHNYQPHEHQQIIHHAKVQQYGHVFVNVDESTSNGSKNEIKPQLWVESTLPRNHHQPGVPEPSGKVFGPTASTLPRKPFPPTRSITNYTITQRQVFSVIMSLLTFGIL